MGSADEARATLFARQAGVSFILTKLTWIVIANLAGRWIRGSFGGLTEEAFRTVVGCCHIAGLAVDALGLVTVSTANGVHSWNTDFLVGASCAAINGVARATVTIGTGLSRVVVLPGIGVRSEGSLLFI